MTGRLWSFGLSAILLIATGLVGYTILWNGTTGRSAPRVPAGGNIPTPEATSTVAVPTRNSRDDIDQYLAKEAPSVRDAVAAVEAQNVEQTLSYLAWTEFPCTSSNVKGGVAPRCADLGLAEGTPVRMFHYALEDYSYRNESSMREVLKALLSGRNPRLAVVAKRNDGTLLVSFTVDDLANEGLRGVDFIADTTSTTPFTSYTERFVGSTPFDTLRDQARTSGASSTDILYVSPAATAWETEKDGLQRDPKSGVGVTP